MCMQEWPCCRKLGLFYFKKKKKRKRQKKKLWSFAPSDFCPTRIGEALKTWDCVLWVNKGKEISVMWAFALLTHKSVTTSLFLVTPPPILCLDQVSWASHCLGGSIKGLYENISWANMGSCDTEFSCKIIWRKALKTSDKGEAAQIWHGAHTVCEFLICYE